MKRVWLHLAFWIGYLFQNVLLIFLLNASQVSLPLNRAITLALENSLVLLIPKLGFTYFILYVTFNKIIKEDTQVRAVIYSILSLLITLFLYRALAIYLVNPVVYDWDPKVRYFNLFAFLVALMDLGFASGAAIALKLTRWRLKAKETEKNLIREKLETEIKYLRNQTHPHFLFNTLNNIYALARKKSDHTPEVVMKLSKLLRFMLYETAKPSIRIGDEIKMLEDYIELEKIRYNERLTITFEREIDNENDQIAPLLLLPFVENAFKHGASESRFASYIHIDMKLRDHSLCFRVENSKEQNELKETNDHIGLNNVKRQLELMYGDYFLEVVNEPALFVIDLTVKLDSQGKN